MNKKNFNLKNQPNLEKQNLIKENVRKIKFNVSDLIYPNNIKNHYLACHDAICNKNYISNELTLM